MASLTDIIMQQVASSAGKVEIPSNLKNTVLNGLSESVLGGLTQTAAKPGGIDAIKNLLAGKQKAESSPVTALATDLFSKKVLKNLNLGSALDGKLKALVPGIISKVSGFISDKDGDGDVDLNDILLTLKGGSAPKKGGASILGTLGKILGK